MDFNYGRIGISQTGRGSKSKPPSRPLLRCGSASSLGEWPLHLFTLIKPQKSSTNPGNSGFQNKKSTKLQVKKLQFQFKIPKKDLHGLEAAKWETTSIHIGCEWNNAQSRKAFVILFCIHCQQASIFFKLAQTRSTLLFDQFYVLFWNEALNKVSLLVSEVAFILATLGFKWNHPCLTDKCPEKSRASSKTALFEWGNRQQVARCKQKGTID